MTTLGWAFTGLASVLLITYMDDKFLHLLPTYIKPLNDQTFVKFRVVSREAISATNCILTVVPESTYTRGYPGKLFPLVGLRPYNAPDSLFALSPEWPYVRWHNTPMLLEYHVNKHALCHAWDHGVWSIEVKQPQLQIAREYTPLPPRYGHEAEELEAGVLRLLVRAIDGGEVSTYLSRLRPGDEVELRGPHVGLDVQSRLGLEKATGGENPENTNDASRGGQATVLFLAGGTGVAPALQVARKILDGNALGSIDQGSDDRLKTGTQDAWSTKPRVELVWANRKRADCVACEALQDAQKAATLAKTHQQAALVVASNAAPNQPPSRQADTDEWDQNQPGSIVAQLAEIKARHGANFTVKCVVDEERTLIDDKVILDAWGAVSARTGVTSTTTRAANERCRFHSQRLVAGLAGRDLPRKTDSDSGNGTEAYPDVCLCPPDGRGKNLLMVSGPDGFVSHFAGPKVWANGLELQGAVGGRIGTLLRRNPGALGSRWLVLKL
jgi:hypothetical protein